MHSSRISFMILLLVVLGFMVIETAAQILSGQRRDNFYYSKGKKIPLSIATDRIAVVAEDGENLTPNAKAQELQTDPDFAALTAKYRLRLTNTYSTDLLVYSLSNIERRPIEIQKVALEIKTVTDDDQINQAGVVVTPPNAIKPQIVTDEFIVLFKENVSKEEVELLNRQNNVEIVKDDPFIKNQYLLRVKSTSRFDTLTTANFYYETGKAVYSHPNFIRVIETRQSFIPNDPLFINEWHHQNTGQGGGTPDADTDTPFAWNFTRGSTTIAVIDDGFDIRHPDLIPNLWVNTGEIPANNIDDDGNGLVDDVNGYDFTDGDGDPSPDIGDYHGTAVAGVVGARGDNALGVSGACLNCRLMLIRYGKDDISTGHAFDYARLMGAQIITNSWGYSLKSGVTDNVERAINDNALNGRGGLGSIIFFAMNNPNVNDCISPGADISSIPAVIAVSRSTNMDRFDESGFGNCMDLLAPTRSINGRGTLGITTTDILGADGYFSGDYYDDFGGTSSATPLTAGIAGLMLSVDQRLSREQVQRLLQDTADKIEDLEGKYSSITGYSTPANGNATHGFGRVNAFEAVRIAAPVSAGGRGGVDVFLRDNRLDWGNTEQPSNITFESVRGSISHSESVDIKVDAPPYQPVPANSVAFENFADESAKSGLLNRVYVRVRNRGPETATSVTVKLHWTFTRESLPPLPADFWSVFPSDSSETSIWQPLGSQSANVPYSGSSIANTASDAAKIISFDFYGPASDGSSDLKGVCFFAVLDGEQDRALARSRPFVTEDLLPNEITPRDNNSTLRVVKLEN